MPDVLITLHSERASRDELLPALPSVRRALEEGLGHAQGSTTVRISRPEWSEGYDDIDVLVLASPTATSAGGTKPVAEQVALALRDELRSRGSAVRSVGVFVGLFAEGAFVGAGVTSGSAVHAPLTAENP